MSLRRGPFGVKRWASSGGGGATIAFVWDTVTNATSYVLQVGTASGGPWTVHDADVGLALNHDVPLAPGTYYSRVVPYIDAAAQTPMTEQGWTLNSDGTVVAL